MKSLEVLIIATSHKSLGDTSADTGVWLDELASPYYVFKDAGECITISTPDGGIIPIDPKSEVKDALTDSTKRFKTDNQAMYHLSHSLPFTEVKAENYSCFDFGLSLFSVYIRSSNIMGVCCRFI